jgi:phosphatidylinositol glycan class V
MFLVSQYGESTAAFLVFGALFLRERMRNSRSVVSAIAKLIAAIVIALSCRVRSNAILFGVIYLFDLFYALKRRRILASFIAILYGLLLAASFAQVQYVAWTLYCPAREEWCLNTVPSIYSFVQSRYWNNGFLKYWSPNNIPNFLFAAPTLGLIIASSIRFKGETRLWPFIAIQLIILFSSLLFWHVQIVTRVATCLPTIYWFVAVLIESTTSGDVLWANGILKYFSIWLLVQGTLFAAFLPPA